MRTISMILVTILSTAVAPLAASAAPKCASLFDSRSTPKYRAPKSLEAIEAEIRELDSAESALVKSFRLAPSEMFLRVRKQALEAKRNRRDFSYPIFKPIMKRMILDLASRTHEDLPGTEMTDVKRALKEAYGLLDRGIPYKDTMRFTFRYLETLDRIFTRLHPELNGSFHRDHAEHNLEKLLARAPDVLLLPSFQSVWVDFFAQTRSAPLHVIGLHPHGARPGEPVPFADGFHMKPSEFAWHDVGHIEFMAMRDFAYVDQTFKPIERVVQEWDLTRRRIEAFWDSFKDFRDVHDAMGLLLFEVLHERGYQYSFSVLKGELDTPKWTEILMRKLHNDYYKPFPEMNLRLFDELETARLALLRFVSESRRSDQRNHIAALFGEDLAVRVTHYPRVGYARGHLERIEIASVQDVKLFARGNGPAPYQARVEDAILAQVAPTRSSPFDHSTMAKINRMLTAKRANADVQTAAGWRRARKLVILPSKEIQVEFESGEKLALQDVTVDSRVTQDSLQDRHFFEMNQLLGAAEKQSPISFTLHQRPAVYLGTVKYGLHAGEDVLTVTSDRGIETRLPLSEVLVDALQKEDFRDFKRKTRK